MVRVMEAPERFVSGEPCPLISAMNGRKPLPPLRKNHASNRGIGGRPTLLCNAETFAQLAVLAMLGPEGYATTGDPAEPGAVLDQGSCPLGEVARAVAYLAKESAGQCGPCKLGLPGIARSLAALASGSGGAEALDTARRGAAAVRGRGACQHPEG